jgi:hypothetical protein
MALLWIEGFEGWTLAEDLTEFEKKYTIWEDTSDASFALEASTRNSGGQMLNLQETTGQTRVNGFHINIAQLTSDTTLIVGFAFLMDETGRLPVNGEFQPLLGFTDDQTNQVFTLTLDGPDHFLRLRRGESTGTILGVSHINITPDTWYYIELKVTFHDTTGAAELRIDSIPVINVSGVDTTSGTTVIQSLNFACTRAFKMKIDDIYICDTSTTLNNDFLDDVYVEIILPDGNGTTSDMVGSDADSTDNYLLVNEQPSDGDTSYAETGTVGEKDTYNYEDIVSSPDTILGAMCVTEIRKTDTDGRQAKAVCRSVATEEDGAVMGITQNYFMFGHCFQSDPDTGALWLEAAINAAEFGVKITA